MFGQPKKVKKPVSGAEQRKLKQQLANTLVQHGLMLRELVSTKHDSKKALDSPETNAPAQSDIHFQAVMGDEFQNYKNPQKKVKAYNDKYKQLDVAINTKQLQQFSKMYSEEKQHPNQYVLYHGTKKRIKFDNDVVTEFRKQLELIYAENFVFLRPTDEAFALYENVEGLMKTYRSGNKGNDRSDSFKAFAISVNLFVFGSDGKTCEATYAYFLKNFSQQAPTNVLQKFFKRLEIEEELEIFNKIYNEFFNDVGGICYQFFFDASCIDQVAIPAAENGAKNSLKTHDGRTLEKFSDVVEALKKAPNKYADYIKRLQARLYLKPDILHDPKKVTIKTYQANPLTPQQAQSYRQKLQQAVSDCIKKRLEKPLRLTHATMKHAKGNPALNRLRTLLYQAHQLPDRETTDLKILIPELIEKKEIDNLVDLMIAREDLDLRAAYVDYSLSIRNELLLDLFKGEIALAVYVKLHPYINKYPHVAKACHQMQESVWYHHIGLGNLLQVKKLFQPVFFRDRRYLSSNEIFMEEKMQDLRHKVLLTKAISLAVNHNKGQVLIWLIEKQQEHGIGIYIEESLRSAVEASQVELIVILLPLVKKSESFANIYKYLEKRQAQDNTKISRKAHMFKPEMNSNSSQMGKFDKIISDLNRLIFPHRASTGNLPKHFLLTQLCKLYIEQFSISKNTQIFQTGLQNLSEEANRSLAPNFSKKIIEIIAEALNIISFSQKQETNLISADCSGPKN